MTQRYILILISIALFLFLILFTFASWKFLLKNVERTREINVGILELQDIDIERYNTLLKKGI